MSRQQSGKELGAVSAQKSYFVSDWDSSLINEQEDHHRISDLTPFHPKLGRFWVFSLLLLCGPWKNCKSWCVGFGLCDPSKGDYFLSLSRCLVSIIRFGTLLREGRKKLAIVSIFGSWATSLETGLCTASAYFVRELGPFFFPLFSIVLGPLVLSEECLSIPTRKFSVAICVFSLKCEKKEQARPWFPLRVCSWKKKALF